MEDRQNPPHLHRPPSLPSSSSSAAAHHQFSLLQWFPALNCRFPVAVVGFWGFWVSPISGEFHRGWVRYLFLVLFDCKMWMEQLCSWSQEGFMSYPWIMPLSFLQLHCQSSASPEFRISAMPSRFTPPSAFWWRRMGFSYSNFSVFWDRNAKSRPSFSFLAVHLFVKSSAHAARLEMSSKIFFFMCCGGWVVWGLISPGWFCRGNDRRYHVADVGVGSLTGFAFNLSSSGCRGSM